MYINIVVVVGPQPQEISLNNILTPRIMMVNTAKENSTKKEQILVNFGVF